MRPFQLPTTLIQGQPAGEAITTLVSNTSWVLITSAGWPKRAVYSEFMRALPPPTKVISDVSENPKVSEVCALSDKLGDAEIVVAIGGGSVIDAVKGAVALDALGGDRGPFMEHLTQGKDLPSTITPRPIIAIPTTSGTGSEVTPWGTVWGDEKVKYSVKHPTLFPWVSVLDPAFCQTMPDPLTISSGLDAVSHAMEAVWNTNATPISDAYAEHAIRRLFADLPDAIANPQSINLRRDIQVSSMIAGLAMGITQTAACHSISYPFTSLFGVPHGLACSFTLHEIAKFNGETAPDRLRPIARALDCDVNEIPARIFALLNQLNVGSLMREYVEIDVVDGLGDDLITRARAANNIRDIDGAIAREIARASLSSLYALS